MSDKQLSKFAQINVVELDKTDRDKKIEQIEEFVATAKIEAETQLALLKTSVLPTANLESKKALANLNAANAAFEKARFTVADHFTGYITKRNDAKKAIVAAQKVYDDSLKTIADTEKKISEFNAVLEDLS